MPTDKTYDSEIHEEISKRVEDILRNGIPVEIKEQLLKSCPIPQNMVLLEAPQLNPELEGVLAATIKSRDKRIEERQNTLGIALGRILKVTNMMTFNTFEKLEVIRILSEASRILSELHFEHTNLRRKNIIPNLDKNLIQTIENVKRDKYLFGENLSTHIKTSNEIKKSAGSVLKSSNKPPVRKPRGEPHGVQGNYRAPQHFRTQRKMPRGSQPTQHQRPTAFKVQNRRPPMRSQRARYP